MGVSIKCYLKTNLVSSVPNFEAKKSISSRLWRNERTVVAFRLFQLCKEETFKPRFNHPRSQKKNDGLSRSRFLKKTFSPPFFSSVLECACLMRIKRKYLLVHNLVLHERLSGVHGAGMSTLRARIPITFGVVRQLGMRNSWGNGRHEASAYYGYCSKQYSPFFGESRATRWNLCSVHRFWFWCPLLNILKIAFSSLYLEFYLP